MAGVGAASQSGGRAYLARVFPVFPCYQRCGGRRKATRDVVLRDAGVKVGRSGWNTRRRRRGLRLWRRACRGNVGGFSRVSGTRQFRLKPVAERVGFEPTVPFQARRISSAVHSTTLPPLRGAVVRLVERGASLVGQGGRCKRLTDDFRQAIVKARIIVARGGRGRGPARRWARLEGRRR